MGELMNKLKVGYASVNINPPLGIGVYGYYVPRFAKGFLDDLMASTLALSCGEKTLFMISTDAGAVPGIIVDRIIKGVEDATGISAQNVYISATHTHTSPSITPPAGFKADEKVIAEYADFFVSRVIDCAKLALEDLKPAKMGYAVGKAPDRIAYIRRYKMKDGTTMTCPPVGDPNIAHPIGELDQRINVVRFDRKNAKSIVLVNYGLHADTINGELISSDWIGWVRTTLDKSLDGVECICFIGAQGDVGSTNVHPVDGDMNDTEISFDNEMKSPGMARFIGRAIAGTVLQVYDKVKYVDVDKVDIFHLDVNIPANKPDKKDMPLARKYKELHESGRDDLIPYQAMELTTVVAEALRMCDMENGPDYFVLKILGLRIGEIAFIGIPGEPFTEIGVKIKETEGWGLIMPCAQTNGAEGYFPVKSAFDEGGYEARTSPFKSCVSENIINGAKQILFELKNK